MLNLYKIGTIRPYWYYFSMDGVFMHKLIKSIWSIVLILALFCLGGLLADKNSIQNGLIRLHVVAASDSDEDQSIKLSVRDSVISYLNNQQNCNTWDVNEAKEYISGHLEQIENVANSTLQLLGSQDKATVSLQKEPFDTREYETFTLPAGVYDSLRIRIGDGNGKNWWCVIFPSLCAPVTSSGFKDIAASSGFETGLVDTLAGEEGYEIRFFFLDCLGKLENFFHIA